MASTVQELIGLGKLINHLEERITTCQAHLLDIMRSGGPAPDTSLAGWQTGTGAKVAITMGEVEVFESLVRRLARRITGTDPEDDHWGEMHAFCRRYENQWSSRSSSWARWYYDYLGFALLWIQKTRAYAEYLSGLHSAVGGTRDFNSGVSKVAAENEGPQYDVRYPLPVRTALMLGVSLNLSEQRD
jgi:hypothetical protein